MTHVRDKLDRFYTPDDLAAQIVALLPEPKVVVEPSIGGGAFISALQDRWGHRPKYYGVDIDPAAPGFQLCDGYAVGDWLVLAEKLEQLTDVRPDLVIGNPPFGRHVEGKKRPEPVALQHVERALALTTRYVAFYLRLGFLASEDRAPLFEAYPPRLVIVLQGRPSFTGDGKSDRYDGCVLVWDKENTGKTDIIWWRKPKGGWR